MAATKKFSELTIKRIRSNFEHLAPNAPKVVVDAWVAATNQTGISALEVEQRSYATHIPVPLLMQFEHQNDSTSSDIFGNSIDSAVIACAMILYRLNNPVIDQASQTITDLADKEKIFYRAFISVLCKYASQSQSSLSDISL